MTLGKYEALVHGLVRHPARLLSALRAESPARILEVLESLPQDTADAITCLRAFPSTHSEIYSSPPYRQSRDFDVEVRWLLIGFSRFVDPINKFLSARDGYEQRVLRGELGAAAEELNSIEREYGYSLWLLEQRILVAELEGGLEANRTYLSSLDKQSAPILSLFGEIYSRRSETNLSHDNYLSWLSSFFESCGTIPDSVLNWLRFRAEGNISFTLSTKEAAHVLWRENSLSLVDRHYSCIRMLIEHTASGQWSPQSSTRDLISKLSKVLNDCTLTAIAQLHNPARVIQADSKSGEFTACLELYTTGRYLDAMTRIAATLLECPQHLEWHELYAQCAAHHSVQLGEMFAKGSLAQEILESVYSTIQRDSLSAHSSRQLQNCANRLNSFGIAKQLNSYYKTYWLAACRSHTIELHLSASILTPRFSSAYSDTISSLDYISALAAGYGETLCLQVHRPGVSNAELSYEIPPLRRRRYIAADQLRAGKFNEAKTSYLQLLSDSTLAAEYEFALLGLCETCTKMSDGDTLVTAIASCHVGPWPTVLTRVDFADIQQLDFSADTMSKVEWPVYCHSAIANRFQFDSSRALYESYDDYISAQRVRFASDLRGKVGNVDQQMLICFLAKVCVLSVMNSSIAFGSTAELEAERIKLCQWLLEIDSANEQNYQSEIARLTRQSALRAALSRLGTSKIYVNVDGIRRSLPLSLRERYDILCQYTNLSDRLRTTGARVALFAILDDDDSDEEQSQLLRHKKPKLVMLDESMIQFKLIFLEMRDRFIASNEYGLDSYLSVRIRHGTLSGELRSAFEKYDLVTRKRGSSYLQNSAWTGALSEYQRASQDDAIAALGKFSLTVDSIIEQVKTEVVQIRSDHSPQGLFDYEYTDIDVYEVWSGARFDNGFHSFLDFMFAEFWNRTEANCQNVVSLLRGKVQDAFVDALDKLSETLNRIDQRLAHSELSEAIHRCRTELQHEVGVVAGWFEGAEDASLAAFDMQLLVDASIHTLENQNPGQPISVTQKISYPHQLAGRFFVPFSDVLLLLLQNATKHSGTECVNIEVNVSEEDVDKIRISVLNDLASSIDIDALSRRFNGEFTVDVASSSPALRQEGGTGFVKLHKLIQTDLQLQRSEFVVTARVLPGAKFEVELILGGGRLSGAIADN